jgi:hypothetical protein
MSLLVTGTLLPIFATPLSDAVDSSSQLSSDDNSVSDENTTSSDDIFLRADDPSIAQESMILNYIDSDQFNAARHTQRLTDLEDLNTYVFANADGTCSVYLMNENVKYIDSDGLVKEKDLSLTSQADGFGIVQSDIELLIPTNPVQGIDLSYSGFTVKLIPQNVVNQSSAVQENNAVVYEEAYGENTKLIYTPLLSGVKEDIVLTQYTTDAEEAIYTFVLQTNGLYLYEDSSRYYLADSIKDDPLFYLGDILLYDAIGKPDTGTMTVETLLEGQEYLLTITANPEFLSDPTTVYPVTIDPSITISDSTTTGSILDAPIFKGYPSSNFGTYVYNSVGTTSETYGIARTVVKLSGLTSQSVYQAISASQITKVTFYAREASGTSSQYINLYPLTSNTTWTETSVTWNNVGSYTTSVNYGNSMYNGQWTAFDITNLVKAWKNATYSADAGFILINENESNYKCFASSEYSSSSYQPYVVMTYSAKLALSASSNYLMIGQTKQLACTTTPSGLSVSWSSSNTSVATVSSSGLVTGIAEGTVRITATYTDNTTGTTSSGYLSLSVKDSLGIQDDTKYYVMNYSSGRYLSLETASDSSLTNVYTRARSTSTLSQWKTEKQTDGTFQLINVYSSTGKALHKTGTNIDIYTDIGASYQMFSIYRINSGTYKGLYYIRYGSYYVAQDSDYNVFLTTTVSASDVWSFMAVETRYAEMFCHDYTYTQGNETKHFDTSEQSSYFKTVLKGFGYPSLVYINPSSVVAYTFLKRDDVFVFMGHGGPGRIAFYKEGNIATGRILADSNMGFSSTSPYYISDLAKNELCLSRCVLYLGCSTGVDYVQGTNTYNLVDATFEKGAHFVLGTTETLYTYQINNWLEYFLDGLLAGNSIEEAIEAANKNFDTITVEYDKEDGTTGTKQVNEFPLYYVGDTTQYLAIN